MKHIAIFASGNGSNAENIGQYFKDHEEAQVSLVLSNNSKAFVHERAQNMGIPSMSFSRQEFYHSSKILEALQSRKIDLIVLAGFMWLVPASIIEAFPNRIVNIHPALLPKYGGKGMYGDFVHQAVSQAGEEETGITIHQVNEKYDEGDILFQQAVAIEKGEDPEGIAAKVHALEYQYYPFVIEEYLEKL